MRDPTKWGPDADKFVIRDVTDYIKNSVGFAEMAVNSGVANGRMNRDCPGKTLALMIGEAFFSEFKKEEWTADGSISFKKVTPFVSGFTLRKKAVSA